MNNESFYMHPRYNEFLTFLESVQTDARINPNALNLAFDVWLKYQELSECFEAKPQPFDVEKAVLIADMSVMATDAITQKDETIAELKKDLDRKHRECAERERQCALQAEYILELESLVENKADNDKTVKDYALWQAITDLEMFCRHRTATQKEDWLQVESEDRQTKPLIGYALKVLEAANVEIKRRDKFPNILIVYDRNKNEFFGRN